MTDGDDTLSSPETWPECDCGYRGEGQNVEDRVGDAQRHAREVHGIDVSAERILNQGHPA